MEGGKEERKAVLCDEGNVEGQNNNEEECEVSYERETDSHLAQQPFPGQHVLRFPGQRELVLSNGFVVGRRSQISHMQT